VSFISSSFSRFLALDFSIIYLIGGI
ncbi:uncharacterized protein METZ01_LOCUS249220, partial [marine metagenome]